MYRVIRSSEEEQAQGVLPYAENVLQDCVKNGTLVPAKYRNPQTGESYNYVYVKSVVSKSDNAYMCPVSVGEEPDALLFDSSSKIKVSLRQIETGADRTQLKWDQIDPKFTLNYVISRTKQWLSSNLPKLVGEVVPVMSERYRPRNKYGLRIEENYEYVMLVDKADYNVKTGKDSVPNFEVKLTGYLFDVEATRSYNSADAWKRSDSLYPYYRGYFTHSVPLESVVRVTYPAIFVDFPSKDIVLSTIDNLNLSGSEIDYAMSELIRLAEKGSYIPCATDRDLEIFLVRDGNPTLIFVRNGKPVQRIAFLDAVAIWKDDNGYAVQHRDKLFYLNDARNLPDDVNVSNLLDDGYYSSIDLNKAQARSAMMFDED